MREVVIVMMRCSIAGWLGCLLVALAAVPVAGADNESASSAAHAEDHASDEHGDPHAADAGHAHDAADHDAHGHHDTTDLSHANSSPAVRQAESWSADLAIYTFVVFLLLFALLAKFAFKPIAEGLARREQAIADNIAAAEAAARDAEQLTKKYEAKLAAAADEVRQMIEEARRDADTTRQDILAQARQDSEAERNRAIREIHTAKDSALKELATLSARQAVELAGRVVRSKLTPEEQSALIQTALNDLPQGSPSNN